MTERHDEAEDERFHQLWEAWRTGKTRIIGRPGASNCAGCRSDDGGADGGLVQRKGGDGRGENEEWNRRAEGGNRRNEADVEDEDEQGSNKRWGSVPTARLRCRRGLPFIACLALALTLLAVSDGQFMRRGGKGTTFDRQGGRSKSNSKESVSKAQGGSRTSSHSGYPQSDHHQHHQHQHQHQQQQQNQWDHGEVGKMSPSFKARGGEAGGGGGGGGGGGSRRVPPAWNAQSAKPSSSSPTSSRGGGREAYVTVITTAKYAIGAEVVAKCLRSFGTSRPMVALVDESMYGRTSASQRLAEEGWDIIQIPPLTNHNRERLRDRPWFETTFSKLHIFNMTDYDKVPYRPCLRLTLISSTPTL